jgi:hypothetical protein
MLMKRSQPRTGRYGLFQLHQQIRLEFASNCHEHSFDFDEFVSVRSSVFDFS